MLMAELDAWILGRPNFFEVCMNRSNNTDKSTAFINHNDSHLLNFELLLQFLLLYSKTSLCALYFCSFGTWTCIQDC